MLREEIRERVDLVNLHDHLRRILHEHVDRHRIGGRVLRFVSRGKLHVHAILERLERGGREQRGPLLRVADAIDDLRLGEDRLEPRVFHERRVGVIRLLGREQVEEVIAHHRLVVADRRERERGAVELAVRVHAAAGLLGRVHILRVHVNLRAREFEVFEEKRLVVFAARAVELEPLPQHRRLERVEGRRKRLHVVPHAREQRIALRGVELRIRVRRGREFAHADEHVVLVLRECRQRLEERIELLGQQRTVDGDVAKARRIRGLEFRDDQLHEPRHIGPLELAQQRAPLRIAQRDFITHERFERRVVELAEVVVLQRLGEEHAARDPRRIERHRQIRLFVAHLLHMVELHIQPLAQELQRRLRVRVIGEQRRAILDDLPPLALRKALRPLVHDLRELRRLLRILEMERAVEVVVLRAGHELREHRRAIRREGELFDEADLVFAEGGRDEEDERGEEFEFHGDAGWNARSIAASRGRGQRLGCKRIVTRVPESGRVERALS